LLGFAIQETGADGSTKVREIYLGFVNEKGVTEGTKRIANKIGKKITDELTEIEKQRETIKKDGELTDEEKESLSEDELKIKEGEIQKERDRKSTELLNDEVTIVFDEFVDFKMVENMSLSYNYAFVYDRVFKNY